MMLLKVKRKEKKEKGKWGEKGDDNSVHWAAQIGLSCATVA